MSSRHTLGMIMLAALLHGCASAGLEARQLAWHGSGPNPCVFGGVTPAAEAHCLEQRWRSGGELIAINNAALDGLSKDPRDLPCQVHVARAEQALRERPGFEFEPVYSCPIKNNPRGSCHVSLLVTDEEGRRHVLDNGAVLRPEHYTASVASLDDYADELDGVYWIGHIPDNAREIALAKTTSSR